MNQSKLLIRAVLLFLILVLSINYTHAQINESISFSDLNAWDSIFIITNRKIDTTGKNLSFNNEVNENTSLAFLKVTLNTSGSDLQLPGDGVQWNELELFTQHFCRSINSCACCTDQLECCQRF